MKRQEAAKTASQPQPVKVQQAIAGTGSVWNTNSYHWEEKSVNAWATEQLKRVLSTFSHAMNDATVSITEITDIQGEASVSIRKGKKIVSFDYNFKLKWACVLADSDGNQVSKTSGTYQFPEVSNEDEFDEWECRVEYGEDPDNLRACLDQLIRAFAPKALKQKIQADFVEQLKQK